MTEPRRERETIPPTGTEYDPRMGVPHIFGGVEHTGHPGETCVDAYAGPPRGLRKALLDVPHGVQPKVGLSSVAGWNRYDTDDEHVLHLWAHPMDVPAESWDFRAPKAGNELREMLTSAIDEFDNVRWDDIWAVLDGLAGDAGSELAHWSRKYVGYVRDDIEKALALADDQ